MWLGEGRRRGAVAAADGQRDGKGDVSIEMFFYRPSKTGRAAAWMTLLLVGTREQRGATTWRWGNGPAPASWGVLETFWPNLPPWMDK